MSGYATNQELTLGQVFRCGLTVQFCTQSASLGTGERNEETQTFPLLCHCRESCSGYATRLPFSTGIATRFVPRYYHERNRRGLFGTKRRKLRKRAAVSWPVRTVAIRNGCV